MRVDDGYPTWAARLDALPPVDFQRELGRALDEIERNLKAAAALKRRLEITLGASVGLNVVLLLDRWLT